jgi:CubicO group peptidase (beta-lactamase class C family)
MKRIAILLLIFLFNLSISPIVSLDYFPTNKWRKSTPEAQGIDSADLDQMYTTVIKNDVGIDSIHIIRNGYLVYEKYFEYYNHSHLHHLQSVTKSITSILVGIANTTGLISNLDQPVLDIFANRSFDNMGPKKQAITIRHLLRMQMGIEWRDVSLIGNVDKHDYELLSNLTANRFENLPLDQSYDASRMVRSDDWVQYVLDKPMVSDPGTQHNYNSGASHLLSVILTKKTGINTVEFANKYLFTPLNISNYHWWNDSIGISMGAFGLWLQPIDLAKIGYLYLNNGTWNNTTIVPKEWVEISTMGDEVTQEYGFQWWIRPIKNFYYARGLGGQYIIVIPDKSLVIVITSSEFSSSTSPLSFVLNFLEAAMKPDELTTTSEPKTSSSTVNENTSCQLSLLGVLSIILLTINYQKNKQK